MGKKEKKKYGISSVTAKDPLKREFEDWFQGVMLAGHGSCVPSCFWRDVIRNCKRELFAEFVNLATDGQEEVVLNGWMITTIEDGKHKTERTDEHPVEYNKRTGLPILFAVKAPDDYVEDQPTSQF